MSPTTFFHLPRELRDKIYTLLLASTHPFRIHADINLTLIAKCPWDGPISPHPSWLMANKAIQREGIEYIQRIGGVELIIKKKAWWAGDYYDTGIWGAFRPLQMRTLDIVFDLRQHGSATSEIRSVGGAYQVSVTAMSYLQHFINDISGMGALQVLTMSMSASSPSPTPKQIHNALRSVLSQLRLFEYEIQIPYYSNDGILEEMAINSTRKLNAKGVGDMVLLDERQVEEEALVRNNIGWVEGRVWRFTWWKRENMAMVE